MKWNKLGLIFNLANQNTANNYREFAQSPQALVFDDFIRIYYSTREKDATGKYLSHISYVEMDKKLSKILKVSKNMVIPLGNLGCYDEHGIFPLNILRDGNRILGYIGGWSRRVSVSVETSIGLAVSLDDGLTFKRIGDGPVLAASLKEPFLVGDPFVLKLNGVYQMWYIYGTEWVNNPENNVNERVYKIGHAVSKDGINWNKTGKQLISDRLGGYECQALPTVTKINDTYHMYFCYREAIGFRENKDKAYRIGYAYSKDLSNWTRDDSSAGIDVSTEGWDSEMMCYPNIFSCDGKVYMLYNGNKFGYYGFGAAVLEK